MIELAAAVLLSMAPKVVDYTTRPQPREESGLFPDGAVLRLRRGHSLMFTIGGLKRVSVTDPKIADILVIGPDEIRLDGIAPGSTSLLVWDRNGRTGALVEVVAQPGDATRPAGTPGNRPPELSWGHDVGEDYVIGRTDRLRVRVTGHFEPVTIDVPPGDHVTIPKHGRLYVGGVRPRKLQQTLAQLFRVDAADVSVLVVRPRVWPGSPEARTPAPYLADAPAGHKMGPGDWVSIAVQDGDKVPSFVTEVTVDGQLPLPECTPVDVRGLTRKGLDDVVKRALFARRTAPPFSIVVVPLSAPAR